MTALYGNLLFCSMRDDIYVPDKDLAVFKYYHKDGEYLLGPYGSLKKSYCQKRGQVWTPSNKRPLRVRDTLIELEDFLLHHRLIKCSWLDSHHVQLFLNNGVTAKLQFSLETGDVESLVIDKLLQGKLLSDHVIDVVLGFEHWIITYGLPRISILRLNRFQPNSESRLFEVSLPGPSSRRQERNILFNPDQSLFCIWWRLHGRDIYPWSPSVKDEDRANILLYNIDEGDCRLISCHQTEGDPLCIVFDNTQLGSFHLLEQYTPKKANVSVSYTRVLVESGKCRFLQRHTLSLPGLVCCQAFSADLRLLILGCVQGSLLLWDLERPALVRTVQLPFIPFRVAWHPQNAFLLVCNEKGQFKAFDRAFSPIRFQFSSGVGERAAFTIMDLTPYFRFQSTVLNASWSIQDPEASLLLITFDRGPLVLFKPAVSVWPGQSLGIRTLACEYLRWSNYSGLLSLLLTLNLDSEHDLALFVLSRLVTHALRQKWSILIEDVVEKALGAYYAPPFPHGQKAQAKCEETLRNLSRKFFHRLLRETRIEKAFQLAIDINDVDLFVDVEFAARGAGQEELARMAHEKAEKWLNSSSASSVCSSYSTISVVSERGLNGSQLDPITSTPLQQNWSQTTPNANVPVPVSLTLPNITQPIHTAASVSGVRVIHFGAI